MNKTILAIGIILLFIVSSITPMVIGYKVETTKDDSELERMLDNLRFLCTEPSGFNEQKYNDYKKQLLIGFSSENTKDDIDVGLEKEESVIPVEMPSKMVISGPMDSAWPMQSHDTHHTGRSSYSTVDTWDEIWKFKPDEGAIGETPVIDGDGTIYFGCFFGDFHALYPNGTLKWKYKLGDIVWGSSPAIAEDGTVYVGSWDTKLYAFNPNGTLKWKTGTGGSISSSPAIADDGTIYFGTLSSGNSIVAMNPNGTIKWSYKTGYSITSDPAIGDDGTVYCGSGDTYLYALWPNGTLRWRFKTGDEIHGHPSIADDGTIYIGSWDDYLYALYPNGTLKWKVGTGWGTSNCQAIGEDGTIYVGTDRLRAFYPNGTLKWSFNLGANKYVGKSSPAVSADGIIYIGIHYEQTTAGEIIAVNPDGTERWRKKIANDWVDSSPSIGEDGTVYIGSSSSDAGYTYGYLYAFGIRELEANADGPYYGLIGEPVQFIGSATGGYQPYDWHWDFGDTYTSEEQNPLHTYTSSGNYTVTLTVTDDSGNTSDDTTYAWIQTSNTPPSKPTINGPTSGNTWTSYPYTFTTTDPEGAIIWYFIDWGDNTNTGWFGPYASGTEVTKSHTWSTEGTYTIKCKAKDPYDAEGPEGTLTVTMPRNRAINGFFLRFLEQFPTLQKILLYLIE